MTPRHRLFVAEYLRDLSVTKAAVRAGYSKHSAHRTGYELMQRPDVKAAIDAAMAERMAEVKVDADNVLRMLLDVATADPNDVVQVRRVCCRYCHGIGFRYQRTTQEMRRDRAQHEADMLRKQKDADKAGDEFTPTAFDEQGGEGFHRLAEPHEDCPECFGEGEADVHVQDSRLLTGAARRLFAGVKTTRDGMEVKLRDQDKAVELLGRHLALFADRTVETSETDLAKAIIAARKRTVAPEPGENLC